MVARQCFVAGAVLTQNIISLYLYNTREERTLEKKCENNSKCTWAEQHCAGKQVNLEIQVQPGSIQVLN